MSRTQEFKEFMARVDAILVKKCGLSSSHLADAAWWDLYDSVGLDVTPADVYETAAEYDDLFASFLRLGF